MDAAIDWRFPVAVESTRHPRRWSVACHVPGADFVAASSHLALACGFFFGLAGCGAFRANDGAPVQLDVYSAALTCGVGVDREVVRCEGECGRFDPAGVGVLANLVERLLPETTSLSIALPFEPGASALALGRYPLRLDELAFTVDVDFQDRNLEVQVVFAEPVGPQRRARIDDALSDWWCAAALGAFRDVDQTAFDSSVVPPQAINWERSAMNFTVEKVRASDAIVDALVGIVAWIDRHLATVERLDIT